MKSSGLLRIALVCFCLAGFCFPETPAQAAGYDSGVTATVLKKTAVTANGRKIVYPRTDSAEVTAMTVELAPGAETGWHRHPVPVYAYVVAGTLSVAFEDGSQQAYTAGDAIIEVVDTLHNGKNSGPDVVKLAVFYLGIQGAPNVIKPESGSAPVKAVK